MQVGHKTRSNALAMCRSWFICLHRFIAVRAGAFYRHRFWVLSSGALWRCGVGLGSFVLSVLISGDKGVFNKFALRGSRLIRAGRAAVVVIGGCQSVPSLKRVARQF